MNKDYRHTGSPAILILQADPTMVTIPQIERALTAMVACMVRDGQHVSAIIQQHRRAELAFIREDVPAAIGELRTLQALLLVIPATRLLAPSC